MKPKSEIEADILKIFEIIENFPENKSNENLKNLKSIWLPIAKSVSCGDIEAVSQQLKNGAVFDGNIDQFILYIAVARQNLEMVQCLIEHKANPRSVHIDYQHYDPLLLAINTGQCKLVRYLKEKELECGFKVSLPYEKMTKTPIFCAVNNDLAEEVRQELVCILLELGEVIGDERNWSKHSEPSLPPGIGSMMQELNRLLPSRMGLFSLGSEATGTIKPLILLRFADDLLNLGRSGINNNLERYDVSLKNLGESLNGRDLKTQQTALHQEVVNCNKDVVLKLLNAKANIDLVDSTNRSPYDLALTSDDPFIRTLLMVFKFEQKLKMSNEIAMLSKELESSVKAEVENSFNAERNLAISKKIHVLNQNSNDRANAKLFEAIALEIKEFEVQEEKDLILSKLKQIVEACPYISNYKTYEALVDHLSKEGYPVINLSDIKVSQELQMQGPFQKVDPYLQKLGIQLLGWFGKDGLKYQACADILKQAKEKSKNFNINGYFTGINGGQYSDDLYRCMEEVPNTSNAMNVQSNGMMTKPQPKFYRGIPLCVAVGLDDIELVKLLIDEGADVNVRAGTEGSPLFGAVRNNNLAMVQLLLSHHARITIEVVLAVRLKHRLILSTLLESKPNINEQWPSPGGPSALLWAIHHLDEKLIQELLEHKADVKIVYTHVNTLLHCIASTWEDKDGLSTTQTNILGYILDAGGDPNQLDQDLLKRKSPLALTIAYDKKNLFEAFLKLNASKLEHIQYHYRPLKSAQNQPTEPEQYCTALMVAAKCSTKTIFFLKRLLEMGAEINAQTKLGQTALMMSSYFGTFESVRILLAAGADCSMEDREGNTAFTLALKRPDKNLEIMTELLFQEWKPLLDKLTKADQDKRASIDEKHFREFVSSFAGAMAQQMIEFKYKKKKGSMLSRMVLYIPVELLKRLGVKDFHCISHRDLRHRDLNHRDQKKMITIENLHKIIPIIFQNMFSKAAEQPEMFPIPSIILALWNEYPLKKAYDKHKQLGSKLSSEHSIDQYETALICLPKQMNELSHVSHLAKINQLNNEIEHVLELSLTMNQSVYENERLEKRRQNRIKAINKVRLGNEGNNGEPAEVGLAALCLNALNAYKEVLELQKGFYLSYSGNPNYLFDCSSPESYRASIVQLMFINAAKHNQTSHVYISTLLKRGYINKAKLLIENLQDRYKQAMEKCSHLKEILETMQTKLHIAQKSLEEDKRYYYNDKNKKSLVSKTIQATTEKHSETEDSETPTSDSSNSAETKKKADLDPQTKLIQEYTNHCTQLKAYQQVNDAVKQVSTDSIKHWEQQRLVILSKVNTSKTPNKRSDQRKEGIKQGFKANHGQSKYSLTPKVEVKQSKETSTIDKTIDSMCFLRMNHFPQPINLLRDWQIESRLRVADHQGKLRHLLKLGEKQNGDLESLIIDNNALLLSMALLMENAKHLKGGNQVFPATLARKFRNAIVHGWEMFPDLGSDQKLLFERNSQLQAMAKKLLVWIDEDFQLRRLPCLDEEVIFKEIDSPLFSKLCQTPLKDPNYTECRRQLKVCDENRLLYHKKRDHYDSISLNLAQDFTTAQASTYFRDIELNYNRSSWNKEISQEELALLSMQYGDDVPLGQGIRHIQPRN